MSKKLEHAGSCPCSETNETEAHPSCRPLKICNFRHMLHSSFSPWGGGWALSCISLSSVPPTHPLYQQQAIRLFVFSHPQASRVYYSIDSISTLERQYGSQSLRWPPKKTDCWICSPAVPFEEESGSWKFPLDYVACASGRDYSERVPQIFLLSLLWQVLCSSWVQKPLNLCSESFKRNCSMYYCWISVSVRGRNTILLSQLF